MVVTINPLMSACPLFCELNNTAKLKGMNINTILALIGITHVLELWFEFAKIKGAKIILHVKSPIFRAAKLKGFTVTVFMYIYQ